MIYQLEHFIWRNSVKKIIKNSEECPKIKPREPLDDNFPDGYMQSDVDFVNCNIEAATWLLEKWLEG